jgi:diaminopimelate epimerase
VGELALEKYEGLGNDFLILIDLERTARYDAALASALCDRHRGVGADGLIRLSKPLGMASLRMELLNADGSTAETSGNGLRCAVLCALDHGLIGDEEVAIETIVGTSVAQLLAHAGGAADVRVEMGAAAVRRSVEFDRGGRPAYTVEIGNPHLALLASGPDELDILDVGPGLESAVPGGQNVELATAVPGSDLIDLATWERGAGFTLACGTGSCAVAAAARFAGLVGDHVEVRNPGGTVTVDLQGALDHPSVVLRGAARRVAHVTVDLDDLDLPAVATPEHV